MLNSTSEHVTRSINLRPDLQKQRQQSLPRRNRRSAKLKKLPSLPTKRRLPRAKVKQRRVMKLLKRSQPLQLPLVSQSDKKKKSLT